MRVLFISNYYPPYTVGGYEQWCQEVARAFSQRGHEVRVLTSRPLPDAQIDEEKGIIIYRYLHLEVSSGLAHTIKQLLRYQKQFERENNQQVEQLLHEYQPDCVLFWGMWNIARSVVAMVESLLPNRVAYYFCDYWPSLPSAYIQRWQTDSRRVRVHVLKQLLAKLFLYKLTREPMPQLQFQNPYCVSKAVREILVEKGVPVKHAKVIYGGTQINEFLIDRSKYPLTDSPRLLYIGRLVQDKGVHCAIAAVKTLADKGITMTLNIYGNGEPDYVASLKERVNMDNLEDIVHFRGSVPREEVPSVFADHDVLVFSSEWEEPFARTVLEAMAAGLLVVGTTTGGTGEILLEGQTGLTFSAGNADMLAKQLARLKSDPALRRQLAQAGQVCVSESFTFSRMVTELESACNQLLKISAVEAIS